MCIRDSRCADLERGCREVVVAGWCEEGPPEVVRTKFPLSQQPDQAEVESVRVGVCHHLLSHREEWLQPGGLVLLVYSCCLTWTLDALSERTDGGALVYEIAATNNLTSLLLRGPNPKLLDQDTNICPIGILMNSSWHSNELEVVPECLASPALPIWIMMFDTHCSLLIAHPLSSQPPEISPQPSQLIHYDGFPASLKILTIQPGAEQEQSTACCAVADVVQAWPPDKQDRPYAWRSWRFEAFVIGDPEGTEAVPPAARWRCGRCWLSDPREYNCYNDPDAVLCKTCDRGRGECGESVLVPYVGLPVDWRDKVDSNDSYKSKVAMMLCTKWPAVEIVNEIEIEIHQELSLVRERIEGVRLSD
eukprot:TRINITY_DN3757_c0_g1_i9.p1 TRINITY_DN3757_c0_g1~~TRINITY_DN3757_c0_g1_i9.p1  ORF type:complete len:362 (-),score=65.44 TRINITY_DN3757_c0_g1_i9:146-1231(-)